MYYLEKRQEPGTATGQRLAVRGGDDGGWHAITPARIHSITITLDPAAIAIRTARRTLDSQGDQTLVVLSINPAAAGVAQPAHIHVGDCRSWHVSSADERVDGKSSTTVRL